MEDISLKEVRNAMDRLIKRARDGAIAPNEQKTMRLYSTNEVCQMIGKSTTTLYNAEVAGVINKPEINPENGRRVGYTLDDINILREHFSILIPGKFRKSELRLGITAAIYNFKGGVGKTTTAVCLAQYLAINGYKTLLIDMDSQGSATTLFGYIPEEDITADDTVLPYTLYGEKNTLEYAIRKSHIDGLFLIPSNQELSSSEFEAAAQISRKGEVASEYFQRLRDGIDTIKNQFDFIIVDAPPSLGIIGIQTLISVDNVVIPCPPKMLDFISTKQFLETATEYLGKVAPNKVFNSIKVMGSMFDRQKDKSKEFMEVMERVLGPHMYSNKMLHSESVDDSSAAFKTPWESEKPDKRMTTCMKHLFKEISYELISKNKGRVN